MNVLSVAIGGALGALARYVSILGIGRLTGLLDAFSWEIAWYLREQEWMSAAAYVIGSVVLGVAAFFAGSAAMIAALEATSHA